MRVFFSDPDRMAELGYPRLSYCPFVIGPDGSYPKEVNQYLRERSLAEWLPRLGQTGTAKMKATVLTVESRRTIARRLIEFLRMCDRKKKDWRTIDYNDDLLANWQPGLLTGIASTSGKKLKNSTVNVMVDEAIMFLTWAAERKYRPPFSLILNKVRVNKSKGNHTYSHLKSEVETRLGALPEIPVFLTLPSNEQVNKWLHEVHYLKGPVKRLTCESICRTGLRITECSEMLVSDFPVKPANGWPKKWLDEDAVPVWVHRGNKGPKVRVGSKEVVKPRWVYFPVDLADRITHYITEGRTTLILRGINSIKEKSERSRRMKAPRTDRLWIGERYGVPISSAMIYRVWTEVPSCPERWHPHIGREFFSVETIVNHMQNLLKTRDIMNVAGVNQLGWLDGLMVNQIRIVLSPLLGHVSEETTQMYLKAAKSRLVEVFGHPALLWADICDDGEDDDEID